MNFDVTNLRHISVVEINFIQDELEEREDIFRLKFVSLNADSRYSCTEYEKEYPGGTHSLTCFVYMYVGVRVFVK